MLDCRAQARQSIRSSSPSPQARQVPPCCCCFPAVLFPMDALTTRWSLARRRSVAECVPPQRPAQPMRQRRLSAI
nr:hypothetical protein RPNZKVPU_RPNZKVPU_CDS_0005 [Microvirus sp.]